MPVSWNLPGKIYLVEAASAKRLTVRAEEALQRADVVFYDEAVAGEALEMVPSWAAVYNVEKAGGIERVTQEEINQRVIGAVRSGQTVVRLKAEGSAIFGHMGDEISALREAGIEVEILADTIAKAEEVIALYRAEDSRVEARDDLRV